MSAITVDGDLVHYEVLGRGGRPVILLHGWIGSWRYWIPTMRQLQLKFRVYAIDLFGYGDSGKNPEKYPLEQQINMVDQFMKQLGVPKAAFLAHGLGAQVAVEFAKRFPDRVARMLIVSAPFFDPGDLGSRVPPGKQVLLTDVNARQKSAGPTTGDKTIPNRSTAYDFEIKPSASEPDKTIPSASRETIPNPNMIDREALRRAALAQRRAQVESTATPTATNNNQLKQALIADMEDLLNRCFKKSDPEYEKLFQDIAKGDSKVIEYSYHNFDAGRVLDLVRTLPMPIVVVHGEDDPLIPPPGDEIWDYITEDKDDKLLPVPLSGVRHFPMLEHETFQRLVGMFLEMPDISKIELKERWRRRSR
jgi:pimeloyl-ACP methyl ester carboxylesterase